MSEPSPTQIFPRRDANGRVLSLAELILAAVAGTAVGLVALVVIDGVFALIGIGTFGRTSGWLAAVLPAFLFFDEFRAWRAYRVRILIAIVATAVAVVLGLVVAAMVSALPPMLSGAVGAAVAAAAYSPMWFFGIRRFTGERPELETR
jgi:hypothetical protein